MSDLTDTLRVDRVLAVVRAEQIPDATDLCRALAEGGIRTVELTFTTPDVLTHITRAVGAAQDSGSLIGVGTVMTGEQAKAAIDAGAQFLVTPGIRPAVAEVAASHGVPVCLGAFTPSEVAQAMDLGSFAVKIFPAGQLGPKYLKDLHGPFPTVDLLPSGGIDAGNAASYLDAGAVAVCAGTSVVSPATVAAGEWTEIRARAEKFVAALPPPVSPRS